jgi:hypothetical protein
LRRPALRSHTARAPLCGATAAQGWHPLNCPAARPSAALAPGANPSTLPTRRTQPPSLPGPPHQPGA